MVLLFIFALRQKSSGGSGMNLWGDTFFTARADFQGEGILFMRQNYKVQPSGVSNSPKDKLKKNLINPMYLVTTAK